MDISNLVSMVDQLITESLLQILDDSMLQTETSNNLLEQLSIVSNDPDLASYSLFQLLSQQVMEPRQISDQFYVHADKKLVGPSGYLEPVVNVDLVCHHLLEEIIYNFNKLVVINSSDSRFNPFHPVDYLGMFFNAAVLQLENDSDVADNPFGLVEDLEQFHPTFHGLLINNERSFELCTFSDQVDQTLVNQYNSYFASYGRKQFIGVNTVQPSVLNLTVYKCGHLDIGKNQSQTCLVCQMIGRVVIEHKPILQGAVMSLRGQKISFLYIPIVKPNKQSTELEAVYKEYVLTVELFNRGSIRDNQHRNIERQIQYLESKIASF